MIPPVIRAYEAKIDVNDGERAVVAKVNTAAVDRYKTVIEPRGIDLKAYRTNPVVLWEHGRDVRGMVPIGRAAWIKYDKSEDALVAKTIYHDDEFSDSIFRLYQSGVLRGYSVNVLPQEYSKPTPDEVRKRPDLADAWLVYRSSELGEYSSVSVPGNAEALTMAVSRGIAVPAYVARALERASKRDAADGDGTMNEEEEEPIKDGAKKRYIKKKGDKYVVYSEDGEELGEHDTREEADKQLAAIEANKKKGRSAPPPAELPPLTGRSFEQAFADQVGAIRGYAKQLRETEQARADLRRGKV